MSKGKIAGLTIAGILAIVLLAAFGFGMSWLRAGTEIVSPDNVREQHRAVIEGWEALEAAASNACSAENAETTNSLVEDPAFAYAAQYRKVAVDYNRRQANLFEARAVGPKGYPRDAPTLPEMQREVCP